ncbi:MAG: hypothetical protein GEV10_19735 [Streptosporangiales bacterium]|nr:hypothetical protein [Streptosporangiales bacterium]
MKAAADAMIRTTVDVTSDFRPERTIPSGTEGHVLETYDSPREGYAVELQMGDDDIEVVTLHPDQFEVVE